RDPFIAASTSGMRRSALWTSGRHRQTELTPCKQPTRKAIRGQARPRQWDRRK
ncbi:unnamed protein product, partial [Ascophyllum nodosum]